VHLEKGRRLADGQQPIGHVSRTSCLRAAPSRPRDLAIAIENVLNIAGISSAIGS